MRNNLRHSILFLSFLLGAMTWTFSQSLSFVRELKMNDQSVWLVDGTKNIVVATNNNLSKYSKEWKLLFEQSQRKSGDITQIGMVNSLKLFTFSENQQLICFYDNSLSSMEKCIDLSDYDLMSVSLVASSGQSDKIWAFDQVNSTLNLLTFNGLYQKQQLKNLQGLLQTEHLTQLLEWENKLCLLDSQKGVYIFDNYGTFVRLVEMTNVKKIQLYKNYLIGLKDEQLHFVSLMDESSFTLDLPYSTVQNFFFSDNQLYLQTLDQLILLTVGE
jgi:hypothetical protein